MNELEELLQSLPGYALLTTGMKNNALQASRIPDSQGRWPAEDGYVATYDAYYAAITLVAFLQAQPIVTQAGSEGTSVSVQAPDWGALLRYYRSMSSIMGASGNDVLQRVTIPDPPHVVKQPMNQPGRFNGDINTDTN